MKFSLLVFTGMALAGAIFSRARNSDKGIKAAETSNSALPKETRTGAGNSDTGIEAAETDEGAVPEEFLKAQKDWESSEWVEQQKKIFVPPPNGDLPSLFKYLIGKEKETLATQTENLVLPDKPNLKALFKYLTTKKAQEYLEKEGHLSADGPFYTYKKNSTQKGSKALN
ncbi:hypothetical protein FCIRC_11920 [Fusarium circinatum]|uniref:Uncharacterized protein n=1 Tax=Fusarium circinatum TaxID=48490 RepID=A0A8H5T2M7_FUSCI|nr:hypothetical protein FCIRC_11920 [Fusarium circinatum]